MSSSSDNFEQSNHPFRSQYDPFLTTKIHGDELHSNLITKEIDSIYNLNSKKINQSYINEDLFMNTYEIFPDFDPEILQIQFINENLNGIDNIRDDEGINKENDDLNRCLYYNEDNDETETEIDDVSSTYSIEIENAPIILHDITNSLKSQVKKPLRRIATPNHIPLKPIICNQKNCQLTFTNKNDYKKHLRTHNILTFQCPYHASMPKHKGKHIFNRMDVWKRHLRTFHFQFGPNEDSNQGLGKCRICGEFFQYFNIFADEHIEYCSKRLKNQLKNYNN